MAALSPEVVLTRLAGGPALAADELAGLDAGLWQIVAERAAEHRVEPLLHHRCNKIAEIPPAISAKWGEAYRGSAISVLAHQAQLVKLAQELTPRGIRFLALKGAWLGWHAYPDPALRPLRDLDLLVPKERALDVRSMLIQQGWSEDCDSGLPAEEWLARFKHLPPLVSPEGIVVELHVRLWDDDGRMPPDPADLFGRAQICPTDDRLAYPSAIDMLMHLSVHACFHRFDGGPLMLADFDYLLRSVQFDWAEVWKRAHADGWDRMLSLVLASSRRWGAGDLAQLPDSPIEPPPGLVEAIPYFLAKPLADRDKDIAAAKRARRDVSMAEKLRRVIARRERFGSLRGYLAWVANQLRATGSSRLEAMSAMDEWLVG